MQEKILLTQFEYDYLIAKAATDDISLRLMGELINKGYFSTLRDWFETCNGWNYKRKGSA